MSFIPGMPLIGGASSRYTINNSLRFRSGNSASLSRTNSSTPTNNRIFTLSCWLKRGSFSTGAFQTIFGGSSGGQADTVGFGTGTNNAGDQIQIRDSSVASFNLLTNAVYRDPTAHSHLLVAVDTTQATAANRVRLYWNGVEVTSFSSASYPAQNYNFDWNTASRAWTIGQRHPASGLWFYDGYLSDVILVDGQQLTPASFGQLNATTNSWTPRRYTGTYGTNGFYLPFNDATSTTTISQDRSGNGNNWTSSGISVTSGITFDQMLDTPTNNYATLNRLAEYGNGFVMGASDGNLQSNPGGGNFDKGWLVTIPLTPGMRTYCEATFTSTNAGNNGGVVVTPAGINSPGDTATSVRWMDAGDIRTNSTGSAYGTALSTNDVVMTAVDYVDSTTCRVWYGRNGTWFASGNPATGANPSVTLNPAGVAMFLGSYHYTNAATIVFNFGQRTFAHTPPTGFPALNTVNLSTPTLPRGDDAFDAFLWTGDATSNRDVGNLRFQTDLFWMKGRSNAFDHNLFDRVRGAGARLTSNATSAESTFSDFIQFNTNGVRISQAANNLNNSGSTYVAWNWREGAAYGFDIVTYTGTGSARTVAHGLNAVPHFMIVKPRGGTVANGWRVYHRSLANTQYLQLNSNAAADTYNDWNNTTPTSSVFSVNGTPAQTTNENGTNYVAYLWTEIPGFSRFGGYAGNGSADGTFVWCGFRPRFILIKNITGATSWVLFDTAINPSNQAGPRLVPNLASAESTDGVLDIVANGFKLRENNANINGGSTNYIFAAFAETPSKFANAR